MADYEETGRRPSYNSRGQQRGFRSKPGAPLADPTSNLPMSGASGTAKSNWDSMFKNSLTGNNPLSQEARTAPAPVSVAAGPNDFNPNSGAPDNLGLPKPPSLDILSAGGPTHAQTWGGDSFGAAAPPIPGRSFKNRYGTGSVTFDRRLSSGYGWGSNTRSV
jgi:hypothetical protein